MKKEKNQRRLRNLIISPSIQFRLVLFHVLFVLISALAVCLALWWPVFQQIQTTENLWVEYASDEMLLRMIENVGLAMGLVALISIGYFLRFSHRICGPLVNLGHSLYGMAKGNLTRKVHLRRNDFLKEQAVKVNNALSMLSDRALALKRNQTELERLCRQLPDDAVKESLCSLCTNNRMHLDRWIVKLTPPNNGLGTGGHPVSKK